MKKLTTMLASCLMIASLAGCTSADAKITNANDSLVTIGSQEIKNGEIYEMLNASTGANACLEGAIKTICEHEIEVTDEMQKSAQESLKNQKAMYPDQFNQFLEDNGLTEEEYMNEFIIRSLQASKLATNYIDENFDSLCEKFNPIKATVLTFESQDDASKALSSLKDGEKNAKEVAKELNSKSGATPMIVTMNERNLDSAVLGVIRSNKPDDGWTMIPATSDDIFYVVKVDENDVNNMKEDVVKTLSTIPNIVNDATVFYFEKYGFHVYDQRLYDEINAIQPDLLVQTK